LYLCDFDQEKKDYSCVTSGNEKVGWDPRLGPVIHAWQIRPGLDYSIFALYF
jgi:hypothetical protein